MGGQKLAVTKLQNTATIEKQESRSVAGTPRDAAVDLDR